MNRKILRDKILGCFNGKNVGGTLGAPLEGKNGFFDIERAAEGCQTHDKGACREGQSKSDPGL